MLHTIFVVRLETSMIFCDSHCESICCLPLDFFSIKPTISYLWCFMFIFRYYNTFKKIFHCYLNLCQCLVSLILDNLKCSEFLLFWLIIGFLKTLLCFGPCLYQWFGLFNYQEFSFPHSKVTSLSCFVFCIKKT